ncbi:MAG TPA: cytochrome P450 [Polyangiales bacterium]|nr:cytochrome P450 [Polyangiales bacterium]
MDSLPRPTGLLPVWGLEWWFFPRRFDRRVQGVGDRYVLRFPTMAPILVTTSPNDCAVIFKDKANALRFGEGLRRLAPHEALFGRDMLDLSDGEGHIAFRRDVVPVFHGEALKGYERSMVQVTEQLLDKLPVDQELRFGKFTLELARDVIISTVFGVVKGERAARLAAALDRLDHVFNGVEIAGRFLAAMAMGRWAPFPRLEQLNAQIDGIALEEILERRRSGDLDREDCLALFMKVQERSGTEVLSDTRITQWMRMLLIAGWETTAVTVAWIVERLTRHPEALARCEEEAQTDQHTYMDAVITEALRLRPALPLTVRYAAKEFDLNGLTVPRGTLIAIDIERVHLRPDVYPDPHAFRPERFLETKPGASTFVPFGGGVHRCVGAQFSQFEARIIMRTLLRRFRLAPVTTASEAQQRRNILAAPSRGARVTLRSRPGTATHGTSHQGSTADRFAGSHA